MTIQCAKCSAENREGRKFCAQCGSPLAAKCPQCGVSNEPGEKFCGDCGTPLGPPSAAAARKPDDPPIRVADTPASENLEGERKTVTALFADIKGSTELEQDLDPEEARAIVDPALKLMIDAVHRYDGYVVQSTGDGIFALFGAPIAHEDHPQRALYAALRMQDELRHYSAKLVADGGSPFHCRVGTNTGEVVVRSIATGGGHLEYTPIGHTTNLASRMQAVAPVGSIAINQNTQKLVEGYFALKPLGPTKVKGVSEPLNIYEVTGLGPLRTRLQRAEGRGFTKFIGRQREMEAMTYAAERANAGHGQIVAAMAEPGVGKSRLFYEFKATSQSGGMVLEAFSISHGKASAYLPVIELLHSYFEISSEDDVRKRREKVNGKVLTLDRSLEDTLPYLFGLLGIVEGTDPLAQMDAQIRKRRTLESIKRMLLRESLNQPLMLIFEDLHWIDEETQALLNLLADSIATAKILLLVNYRPEYSHAWGSKTYYTQFRLDPLGKDSAEEMLIALLGDSVELAPLRRLIIERTEGNPFFMEETVLALFDEGALVRNGVVKLARSLSQLKIPTTVQAILTSRIDRLPADQKDLLQTLAVIGKEFPRRLVRKVTVKSDDELNRGLDDLQVAEFVYEQPALDDVEYTFKHALTREVAYGTLLIGQRKLLHELVGQAIESLYTGSLDDHLADLAYHFRQSGNVSKAIKYLQLVGRAAAGKSAFPEAIRQLAAALELVDELPESIERGRLEFGLLGVMSPCLNAIEGAAGAGVGRALMRMRDLCVQLGDDLSLFHVESGLRWFYGARQELAKERELSERALAIAQRLHKPEIDAEAYAGHGYILWKVGEFRASRKHLERAIGGPKPEHFSSSAATLSHLQIISKAYLAWNLWMLGFPNQALKHMAESVAVARNKSFPHALAFALIYSAQLHRFLRDPPAVAASSEEAQQIAAHEGFSLLEAQAFFERGWSFVYQQRIEEGLATMHRAVEALERTGAVASPWRSAPLAEAYEKNGHPAKGLEILIHAVAEVEKTGERFYEAELRRLIGELIFAVDISNSANAEHEFMRAIEVARLQGARSLELRSRTSLARLLQKQDKRAEARAMLAEIYDWFTEGFDTVDLKEAKGLLNELSR